MKNGLNQIWQDRGFSPSSILFVTYSFSFMEFHNVILKEVMKASSRQPFPLEIDVIASAHDNDQSDCFHLKYLMQLRDRFRLYLVKEAPLFHGKAIIAIDKRKRRVVSGIGSSNLTKGGWQGNIEVWEWDKGGSVPSILTYLSEMSAACAIPSGLAQKWKRIANGSRRKTHSIMVLAGKKRPVTLPALLSKAKTAKTVESTLRIVSPYFDRHSSGLLKQCLGTLSGKVNLQVGIDFTRVLSSTKDYEALSNLIKENRPSLKSVSVYAPFREESSKPPFAVPLHAKLVELEQDGDVLLRVFGSANFTGAAWGLSKVSNYELIKVERGAPAPFPDLLPQGLRWKEVSLQSIKTLSSAEDPADTGGDLHGPRILWAHLDEGDDETPPRIEIRYYPKGVPLSGNPRLFASFDRGRPSSELQRLELVKREVEESGNWKWSEDDGSAVLVGTWQKSAFTACEYLEVNLRIGATNARAPVWIKPQFAYRDAESGIPFDDSRTRIDDLLHETRKPIVSDRSKRYDRTSEDEEHDLEIHEREGSEVFSHPDFDFVPPIVALSRKLPRLSPDEQKDLLLALRKMAKTGANSDRLLARALIKSLEEA